MTTTAATAPSTTACTLEIGGMTCASCVGRVERALRKLDGVATAQVNLATEVAAVAYDPARLDPDELVRAVTRAGYTATPHHESVPHRKSAEPKDPRTTDDGPGPAAAATPVADSTLAVGLGLMVLMYVPFYLEPWTG